jgi:hypothetical protein
LTYRFSSGKVPHTKNDRQKTGTFARLKKREKRVIRTGTAMPNRGIFLDFLEVNRDTQPVPKEMPSGSGAFLLNA